MAKKINKFAEKKPYFALYSPTLQREYGLNVGQTLTFGAIVSWIRMSKANKSECCPSYQTLGDFTNQNKKTVEAHVHKLRLLGLLQTQQRYNESNIYYIEDTLIKHYYAEG